MIIVRTRFGSLVAAVAAVTALTALPAFAAASPAPAPASAAFAGELPGVTPLTSTPARYPRAVRLVHSGPGQGRVLATAALTGQGSAVAAIFESRDDGASFREVGRVVDELGAGGSCCGTLYELPRRLGAVPAGTLLWAGVVNQREAGAGTAIRVWRSPDRGRTWAFLSTCADTPGLFDLWEPELFQTADGALTCYYADEGQRPAHSQVIARTTSTDGLTWSGPSQVVAAADPRLRPGMPAVRALPDGGYLLAYEVCSRRDQFYCAAYLRFSSDGADWGDPAGEGVLVRSTAGRYFTHTPTVAVVVDGPHRGRVLLVGQLLQDESGRRADRSGAVLFGNDQGGRGDWWEAPAPVPVPGARDDICPNFSPTLVPSADGARVLEISTDYAADHACHAYYASGPLPS